MLDGIAYLFVFQEAGEVCATAMEQGSDHASIYWAKNDSARPDYKTRQCLNRLIGAFQSPRRIDHIL